MDFDFRGSPKYASPIYVSFCQPDTPAKIFEDAANAAVMQVVHRIGIDVDEEELLKALRYDRDQYNKGYAAGKADMARVVEECEETLKAMFNRCITGWSGLDCSDCGLRSKCEETRVMMKEFVRENGRLILKEEMKGD